MLGTVKPFRRQIVISTGRSDWDRDITETEGSLAALISQTQPPKVPDAPPLISIDLADEKAITPVPGVFSSTDSTRLSILNGSHKTVCADEHETVLVLPDFTMVVGVPPTLDGAKELWRTVLESRLPRMGVTETSSFQTWILPYSCVIMLCSHKRRDNRCAIAAPKLEHAFIETLQRKGWTADTQPASVKLQGKVLGLWRQVFDASLSWVRHLSLWWASLVLSTSRKSFLIFCT